MPKKTFFQLSLDKKERIINAAYDEFIENEYEKVNIRGIASRSGISVGSFYQYFDDKDDLYIHLLINIEKKIYLAQKNFTADSMFNLKVLNIEGICNKKEIDFDRTWYNAPVDIMRKFYFGEYYNLMKDLCREELEEFKRDGKLSDSVDINLVVYMYITTIFNIQLYFRENNIIDENERLKIKKMFLRDILPNGILKKN